MRTLSVFVSEGAMMRIRVMHGMIVVRLECVLDVEWDLNVHIVVVWGDLILVFFFVRFCGRGFVKLG